MVDFSPEVASTNQSRENKSVRAEWLEQAGETLVLLLERAKIRYLVARRGQHIALQLSPVRPRIVTKLSWLSWISFAGWAGGGSERRQSVVKRIAVDSGSFIQVNERDRFFHVWQCISLPTEKVHRQRTPTLVRSDYGGNSQEGSISIRGLAGESWTAMCSPL